MRILQRLALNSSYYELIIAFISQVLVRNAPRSPILLLQCSYEKYVPIARSFSGRFLVKNLGFFLFKEVQFREQNATSISHFAIFPWLYPSTRKLSVQVISARLQTKVSIALIAVSLFIFLSVIQALSIGFAYFVVNHNFGIKLFSFSFLCESKAKGLGDSIKHCFSIYS